MTQFFLKSGVALSSGSANTTGNAGGNTSVEQFSIQWLHSSGLIIEDPVGTQVIADSISLESTPTVSGANPSIVDSVTFGIIDVIYRQVTINIAAGALIGQTATVSWQWNGVPFSIDLEVV